MLISPSRFAGIAGGLLALLALPIATEPVFAQTFSAQTIAGNAVIYGAGRTGGAAGANFGGAAAPAFSLNTGTNRILTFASVTGSVTPNNGNFNDADGVGSVSDTVISAYQGISGISFNANGAQAGRAEYLVGVFISGAPAGFADGSSGSNATSLAYDATNINFSSASPALNQAFFIGDGLTGDGTGAVQQFFAPNGATTLVLGFADAPGYHGSPGSYGDNAGALTASFTVSGSAAAAPEPSSLPLVSMGLFIGTGILGMMRRRSTVPRRVECEALS